MKKKKERKNRSKKPCSRGLVLEGGGAKGAYAFGCIKAFEEHGIKFSCLSGTSVGALNAAILSTRQIEYGSGLWGSLKQKDIYPYKQPATFYKLFFLPIIIIHLIRSYMVGIDYSQKLRRVFSVYLCVPTIATMLAVAFSLQQWTGEPHDYILTALFLYLGVGTRSWIDGATKHPSGRFYVLIAQSHVALILILLPFFLDIRYPWVLYAMIFLAILNYLINIFVAFLEPTFLTSNPLKNKISKVLNSRLQIKTYVTCAVQEPIVDPDGPSYLRLGGVFGLFTKHLTWPEQKHVPHHLNLNKLSVKNRKLALLASAALPVGVVPSVELKGRTYVDGGVVDNVPIFPLITHESCQEIVVIRLNPVHEENADHSERIYRKDWQKIDRLIRLSSPPTQSRLKRQGNYHSRKIWKENEPPTVIKYRQPKGWPKRIITISPSESLGNIRDGTMNFSSIYAKRLMKKGYSDTRKVIKRYWS